MPVFSIGEFSKITGLTVKTLRFYHEQGLLVPSCIDEETGYRYYALAKVETARAITFLRGLDFSVSEIREILAQAEQENDLLEVMERQRRVIEEKIRGYRKVIASLDQFIADEREARMIMTNLSLEIEEKDVAPILMAGVRMKGKYSECGKGFSRIGRSLWPPDSAESRSCSTTIRNTTRRMRTSRPACRSDPARRSRESRCGSSPAGTASRWCTGGRTTSSGGLTPGCWSTFTRRVIRSRRLPARSTSRARG